MKSVLPTLLLSAAASSYVSAQSTLDTAAAELNMIRTLTDNLTTTIRNWSGDITEALAINTLSGNLVSYIGNATTQLRSVPTTFDTTDTFDIGAPTQYLAYSVNASIAALIEKKPQFENISSVGLVVTSLQNQLSASGNFSGVLLSYIPSDILPVAQALNMQITLSLEEGLACFQNMNSSCITAVVNSSRTYQAAVDSGAIAPIAMGGAERTKGFVSVAAIAGAVVAAVFVL